MTKKYTIQEIIENVRYVMRKLGITDHLPTHEQINSCSGMTSKVLLDAGGLKGLSLLMGLPMAPRGYAAIAKAKETGPVEMGDVKPSKAFKIQKDTGKAYGQIQQEQSLKVAGKIDVSAYEGMQTYAERMTDGKEH